MKVCFALATVLPFAAIVAALPQGFVPPPPPPPGRDDPSPPGNPDWDDSHRHRHPPPPPHRNGGFHLQIQNSAWPAYNGQPLSISGDRSLGVNFLETGSFAMTFQLNSGYLYYGGESNDGSVSLWGGKSGLAIGDGFTPFVMANSNGNAPDRRQLSFWNGFSFGRRNTLTVNGQSLWATCHFRGRWVIGWMQDGSHWENSPAPTCYSVSIVRYSQFGGRPGDWSKNSKKVEGQKMPSIVNDA